jgi:ethanolamine ammonia-lyase large subunit
MLNYQSTSYHDALSVRRLFRQRPTPEFLGWLQETGIYSGLEPAALDAPAKRQLMRGLELSVEKVS